MQKLLTRAELAERWQVTPRHIRTLVHAGELKEVRLGAALRYRLSDVERYEEQKLAAGVR